MGVLLKEENEGSKKKKLYGKMKDFVLSKQYFDSIICGKFAYVSKSKFVAVFKKSPIRNRK